jgi:NADH dehydrogenase
MAASQRVLVAGASGLLGGVVTRKLLAAGVPVRALGRNASKLAPLEQAGAEVAAVDMMNLAKLTEACRGIGQIVATANNVMGSGATSPTKIDLTAYQNLCAAARNTGVRRLVFVSFRGVNQFSVVDYFRIKWYVEDAIKRSGVPYVMLRPTAFMEIWIDQILADGMRKKGTATIFGGGTQLANYIAVDDVAEFAVRILAREEIVKETIEVGGPSNLSMNDLATLIDRKLGKTAKRRHIPVFAMKYLPVVVRPFNEVAARMMTMGLYAATESAPFPDWKKSADRFGVTPRTAEAHIEALTSA